MSLLLKVPEAAAELRVSPSWMWELVRTGKVRSIKLGPQMRRIPREALAEYIAQLQAEATDGS